MASYLRVREVSVELDLDEGTVRQIAEEGLVCIKRESSGDELISVEDAERMRVISVLMREMDVNLAGVEVILHMREELVSMRQQFDEVVQTLVQELRKEVGRG